MFYQLSVGLKKVHSKNKMYPEMQHAVADPFFIPPNGWKIVAAIQIQGFGLQTVLYIETHDT